MTSKERMLIAMQNGKPDRVPCAPDFSTMIPQRLTGKPFWEIEMNASPPLWKAYIEAVKYFGTDGWFIYGHVDLKLKDETECSSQVVSRTEERVVVRHLVRTPAGDLTGEITYFVADSCSPTEKLVKSIRDDFPKLRYLYPDILGADSHTLEIMRRELGDLGALGVTVTYPGFQWWFPRVQGGIQELAYTKADYPELIEEWRVMEEAHQLRIMELTIEAKPDFILLGGSGSITLQSPQLFRELSLPTIKQLTRMAKEAGVPTMLHSCGKERALVEMCAKETDLNCVNPLEPPPMGDCHLAEVKRAVGHRMALMGNLHTTDVMLRGTVKEVEQACMKAINDAACDGGFILSTGDQCGRDTPDANIRKLLEVCESHGRY